MTDPDALIDAVALALLEYPQPADATIPDVPFPLESFPPAVASWLEVSARRARVPVAMVAFPFLAFTGSLVGRQLALEVSPGWLERPALWVALVSPTGLGKTPALEAAREPFWTLHHERWQVWRDWTPPDEGGPPPRPPFAPLFVTTTGMASLTRALAVSPGVCLLRDELYGLVRSLDRHQGEDRQLFLSLWSSEPIIPGHPGIHDRPAILHPVVGMVGGLQPLLLERIRNRAHDGFLERFLLVYPTGTMDRWRVDEISSLPDPDPASIVNLLRPLQAIAGASAERQGVVVARTPEAGDAWAEWFNGNIDQHHGSSQTMSGFYRKLPSHLARIALVLHALWHPTDATTPLTGQVMRHAIALVEYLRVHEHRAGSVLGDHTPLRSPRTALATRVIKILSTVRTDGGWVARSDLLRALGRPEKDRFDDVIETLLEQDVVLRDTIAPNGRGRHTTTYRLGARYRTLLGQPI